MKIKSVQDKSIGAEIGLRPGDDLIEINGHPIRDLIDYRFYENDEFLEMSVRRNGETLSYEIEKDPYDSLGLEFPELKFKACGNHCVFCFTDQNPKGLRKSLYFKDEDYRLSFLYGNYTTLTNVKQADLDRMVEQHLSPLYVSVHATDWETRRRLLGIKRPDHLLEKLEFLVAHGIEIHTQIVLCPGINDGAVLQKTLSDLRALFPGVRSTAVVPLGLTKHRTTLPPLEPVTDAYARRFLTEILKWQKKFLKEIGTRFVFASDEFFLRAGEPIPDETYYEEYPQLEDGVGMVRLMLENFDAVSGELPRKMRQPARITLVTGKLAGPILQESILPRLQEIDQLDAQILPVQNEFYGDSITVNGLLTGQDIHRALSRGERWGTVLLSEKLLNYDGLFLDDWTPQTVEERTGQQLVFVDDYFRNLPEILEKITS